MSRQHGGKGWWEPIVLVLFEGQDLVILNSKRKGRFKDDSQVSGLSS